jgi:hypothetical protein
MGLLEALVTAAKRELTRAINAWLQTPATEVRVYSAIGLSELLDSSFEVSTATAHTLGQMLTDMRGSSSLRASPCSSRSPPTTQ